MRKDGQVKVVSFVAALVEITEKTHRRWSLIRAGRVEQLPHTNSIYEPGATEAADSPVAAEFG